MSRPPGVRPGHMPHVTCDITTSLDGYCAGPGQREDQPLGAGGEQLHEWMFADDQPEADRLAVEGILAGKGAYVMGRNMFGPVRGAWSGDWRGWWGEEPPYHAPVFVLTHHARDPVEMAGGTTFHFVTDGIEAAMSRAREAAGELDVAVAGGASTVQQALRAGAIDELRLHVSPVLLGGGERLIEDIDGVTFTPVAAAHSPRCTHLTYAVGLN